MHPNSLPYFNPVANRLGGIPFTWQEVSSAIIATQNAIYEPPDDNKLYGRRRPQSATAGIWETLGVKQIRSQTSLNDYTEAGFYDSFDAPSVVNMSHLPPTFSRYEPYPGGISYGDTWGRTFHGVQWTNWQRLWPPSELQPIPLTWPGGAANLNEIKRPGFYDSTSYPATIAPAPSPMPPNFIRFNPPNRMDNAVRDAR